MGTSTVPKKSDEERLAAYEARNVVRGWDMMGPPGTRVAMVLGTFDVGDRKKPMPDARAWQFITCVRAAVDAWTVAHFLPDGERPADDPYDYWDRVNPISECYGIGVLVRQAVERIHPEGEWVTGSYPGCVPPILAARLRKGELVGAVAPVWIQARI